MSDSFILGIDPSLTATAVSGQSKDLILIDDVISAAKGCTGVERLDYIERALDGILSRTEPDLIVIEGYSHGSQWGREALGELGGVLRLLFYRCNIKTLVVAPRSLKKFVVGSGGKEVKKEQMLLAAFKRWGAEFTSNDACDAFCLCKLGLAYLLQDKSVLTIAQRDVLQKVSVYFDPERRMLPPRRRRKK